MQPHIDKHDHWKKDAVPIPFGILIYILLCILSLNCFQYVRLSLIDVLFFQPEPDSPAELGFQHKYGSLLQHKWFGDGYILLGFSQGNVVAISTHPKEVGQELWQIRNHRDSLSAIAVSRPLEQIASCGDDKYVAHLTCFRISVTQSH